jgi:hypothetical protein
MALGVGKYDVIRKFVRVCKQGKGPATYCGLGSGSSPKYGGITILNSRGAATVESAPRFVELTSE